MRQKLYIPTTVRRLGISKLAFGGSYGCDLITSVVLVAFEN